MSDDDVDDALHQITIQSTSPAKHARTTKTSKHARNKGDCPSCHFTGKVLICSVCAPVEDPDAKKADRNSNPHWPLTFNSSLSAPQVAFDNMSRVSKSLGTD
mmetsp:Transcript_21614/g.37918  ORF Transcript_21614/g.37918 Transcript_21614/m.37918 type:complete len:102 (+) Transcript_21614:19-324(+)